MRNPLNDAPPDFGAQGGRSPKCLATCAAVAIIAVSTGLAIGAFVSTWRASPPATQGAATEAAKAAARAMTFTQRPEPTK